MRITPALMLAAQHCALRRGRAELASGRSDLNARRGGTAALRIEARTREIAGPNRGASAAGS